LLCSIFIQQSKTSSDMKAKMFFLLTASAMIGVFFTACGNEAGNTDTTETVSAPDSTAQKAAPANDIKLTPFPASPEFPAATLDFSYQAGKVTLKTKGYELKQQTPDAGQKMCANSKDGQHVHLIIDNEPYDAIYASPFEKAVPDGSHYFVAFLGRSYHESVKTPAAVRAYKAEVKGGNWVKTESIEEPMLIYSRPKGKYVGKAETDKVMLDFYLLKTELSASGNKVKVLVNGENEFTIDTWTPFFLEGLPMGDNKVKLTLVDKDGKPVDAPLNPVERVFTLVEDPTEVK
jgi:hypothetical protein